jgi:hypothetical protein
MASADQDQQAAAIDGAEDPAVPGDPQDTVHPGTAGRGHPRLLRRDLHVLRRPAGQPSAAPLNPNRSSYRRHTATTSRRPVQPKQSQAMLAQLRQVVAREPAGGRSWCGPDRPVAPRADARRDCLTGVAQGARPDLVARCHRATMML